MQIRPSPNYAAQCSSLHDVSNLEASTMTLSYTHVAVPYSSKVTGDVFMDTGSPKTSKEDAQPAPKVATYYNPMYRPALEDRLSSTDVTHAALSFRYEWWTHCLICWCMPPKLFRGRLGCLTSLSVDTKSV